MSSITINSNLLALQAQRRINDSSGALTQSFERLSSGMRINRASDDAAGLSVSSRLLVDRRVMQQGVRNINDGISALVIAESALSELSEIVTRIQEIAEQSANGTIADVQRGALQQQVTALQDEYNRILKTTSFNGNQLLTAETARTTLQGGFGDSAQLTTQVGAESLGIAGDALRAGGTTRVDTASDGTGAANGANARAISADGRYVVLYSASTNLVSGDSNGAADVFIKDVLTGNTTLVSSDSNGTQANGSSESTAISADGRYVVLWSAATNLVSGDSNGVADIFLKDTATGTTLRVSTAADGTQANAASTLVPGGVSADGRYVLFNSSASNLVDGDTNGATDAFVKDTYTGKVTRISTDSSGNQVSVGGNATGISADGRYVTFESAATNLVNGDTNAVFDVFMKDLVTGTTTRVSTSSSGDQAGAQSSGSRISADGRYVVFQSAATNLVAGDTNAQTDVFIKDVVTGTTTRVSTDSSGTQASGGSSSESAVSADGRYVLFTSRATNLVQGDTNGQRDVFIKDLATGETRRVSTDSAGNQFSDYSMNSSISADGRYALFELFDFDDTFQSQVYLRDLSKVGVQEISGMLVSSQGFSRATLSLSKRYQEELQLYRGNIGSNLARAATFISTLQNTADNYAQASSRITDIDVAEEAARLNSTRILQQVSASVLAQANVQPEIAKRLLSGV